MATMEAQIQQTRYIAFLIKNLRIRRMDLQTMNQEELLRQTIPTRKMHIQHTDLIIGGCVPQEMEPVVL